MIVSRVEHCSVHDEEIGIGGRQAFAIFHHGIRHGQGHKAVGPSVKGAEGLQLLLHQVKFGVVLIGLVGTLHVGNGVVRTKAGKGVHVTVRVVACQVAMVEPKDLTSAETFAELLLQSLFGGMACVAVRCKQAMTGGEQSAHTVTLDGTTLQHKVEAIHILAFHHSSLVQAGVYLIVQVGGKLHAPSVEAEVEMD